MMLAPLPIDEVLPQIVAALRTSRAVVLRAPTGAGKTTRVPPAVLDAGSGPRRFDRGLAAPPPDRAGPVRGGSLSSAA